MMTKFFDFHHHHPDLKSENNGIYNLSLKEEIPDGYFSAGIHPQDISKTYNQSWQWLDSVVSAPNCLAIGECGLDATVPVSNDLQEKIFSKQIDIANYLNKPIIIHCVRRHSEVIPWSKFAKVPLIIHGFNKKVSIGRELLQHGFYLSFGSAVLRNVSLQSTVAETPLNQLFLETDNDAVSLKEIYAKVAEIKHVKIEKLQEQIIQNLENIMNGK